MQSGEGEPAESIERPKPRVGEAVFGLELGRVCENCKKSIAGILEFLFHLFGDFGVGFDVGGAHSEIRNGSFGEFLDEIGKSEVCDSEVIEGHPD